MEALTSISSMVEGQKPTFFECIAQTSMDELLRPTVAYILNASNQSVGGGNRPNSFSLFLIVNCPKVSEWKDYSSRWMAR